MDEETALQLVMSLSGTKAELLHKKIAMSFTQMKVELYEWRQSRKNVIKPTKACNDSIKWLSDQLKIEKPDSSAYWRVYLHIQQAIAKAASGSAKTKRESMTAEQLKTVEWLEMSTKKEIERMKVLGISAAEIRKSTLKVLKAV